ncbi:hypothetical protein SRHO_G00189190 [Serrasalmus rhombeus]
MLGVSTSTVFRRMREFGLSAGRYSSMSDEELDRVVHSIENEMPSAGCHMVKGRLGSLGIHVQWRRVAASMHRVDVLFRLGGLGSILSRTYSVMFLSAATNNFASTAFAAFKEAIERNGVPSR